jgi:hypothetical protein
VIFLPRFIGAGCGMFLMGGALFTFVYIAFPANRAASIFLLGAFCASVPWGLWNVALVMGGGASWRAGAEAERWSGTELGLLGPRWRIEHGIPLSGKGPRSWTADVDHVAIGPYGVLVAETKYTSTRIDLDASRPKAKLLEAIAQVERNAVSIERILGADLIAPLIPVLIWWGPGVGKPTTVIRREGETRIVRGADADQWRGRIAEGGDRISEDVVDQLISRIREHVREELELG